MNWCKPHWNRLREGVEIRGLSRFGAQDARSAHAELASQLEGKEETFDPLLGAWSRINANMLDSLEKQGRASLALALRCPCCILEEDGQPHLVDNWINGVLEDALAYAKKMNFVKEHQ